MNDLSDLTNDELRLIADALCGEPGKDLWNTFCEHASITETENGIEATIYLADGRRARCTSDTRDRASLCAAIKAWAMNHDEFGVTRNPEVLNTDELSELLQGRLAIKRRDWNVLKDWPDVLRLMREKYDIFMHMGRHDTSATFVSRVTTCTRAEFTHKETGRAVAVAALRVLSLDD